MLQKCSVCDGTGLVSRPPFVAGDVPHWSDSSCATYPCRVCSGVGVINADLYGCSVCKKIEDYLKGFSSSYNFENIPAVDELIKSHSMQREIVGENVRHFQKAIKRLWFLPFTVIRWLHGI